MTRPGIPNLRIRRRNEAYRKVEKPEDVELTRRPKAEKPSEAVKAAVLAALLVGGSISDVAAQYGLTYPTVYAWKKAFDITSPAKRRDRLTDMLIDFVEEELVSLTSISVTTRDEEWVLAQNASDLAQYVAVKEDRLLTLLQAYGRASAGIQEVKGELTDSEVIDSE